MINKLSKIKTVTNRLNPQKRLLKHFYPKNPVYIFHHIPKCGGTSLSYILNKWFVVVRDYRKNPDILVRLWLDTDINGPLGIGGITAPDSGDIYICNVADSFVNIKKSLLELIK